MNRLEEFGIKKVVNKTRLKSHLFARFPEAQEQCNGKSTILVFNEGMTNMLNEALKDQYFTEDAVLLAKAAAIVRKDIFNHQCFKFTGSFAAECQEDSLPSCLVSMLLNRPSLKDQGNRESQACLTIGHGILYNTKKGTSYTDVKKSRHTLEREPPLPYT